MVENDDVTYSASDALRVHDLCGIRMVFDNLHHLCNNPRGDDRLTLREGLSRALANWPANETPKVHYSCPRTEAMEGGRKGGKSAAMGAYQSAPELRLDADYVNPFEFLYFLEKADGLRPSDVMVEAKAKDLAARKLRADLVKYGPVPI